MQSGEPRGNPKNDPCVLLAGMGGINSLPANADARAQQENADAMIDFAKQPVVKNEQALVDNEVVYRKHPRNTFNIDSVVPSTPPPPPPVPLLVVLRPQTIAYNIAKIVRV